MQKTRRKQVSRTLRMTKAEADLWMANAHRRKSNFSDYVRRLLDEDAKRVVREQKVMDRIVAESLGPRPDSGDERIVRALGELGQEERCPAATSPSGDRGVMQCDKTYGHGGPHLSSREDGVTILWGMPE